MKSEEEINNLIYRRVQEYYLTLWVDYEPDWLYWVEWVWANIN